MGEDGSCEVDSDIIHVEALTTVEGNAIPGLRRNKSRKSA